MRRITEVFLVVATLLVGIGTASSQTTQAVAQKAAPAVVAIEALNPQAPLTRREVLDEQVSASIPISPNGSAVGSGTLVSADGLIVTAASLLDNGGEIRVTTHDGARHIGKIVGRDAKTGIALIKISGKGLPYLTPIADKVLELGAPVVALGRTLLEPEAIPTVAEGVIGMAFDARSGNSTLIQATVQTLPSMGGGPLLLTENGAFVGINGHRFISRSNVQSITFSTPMTEYARVSSDLLRQGFVDRAVIGVGAITMSDETRSQLGLAKNVGVMLSAVRPDGPAARAGLLAGDIVISVDRAPVTTIIELFRAFDSQKVGTKHSIRYFRRGAQHTIEVVSEAQARVQ